MKKSQKAPVTAEVELSFSSILLRRYDNLDLIKFCDVELRDEVSGEYV